MSSNVQHLNNDNFDLTLNNTDKLVLVDFWAPWCGPCKNISLIVDELVDEFTDEVLITKVNVDDAKELLTRFGLRGIPALLVFRNGEQVGRINERTKSRIVAELETYL